MLTPHHIGYRQGYRGINWNTFDETVSPVVEIVSMHGCAESAGLPVQCLEIEGNATTRVEITANGLLLHRYG